MKREGITKRKSILGFIGVFVAAMILLLSQYNRAEAAVTGSITATTLFMRTGPSTEYPKVTVDGKTVFLSRGDSVAISYQTSNGWYYITANFDGQKIGGYVSSVYVAATSAVPTAAPTSKPTATSTPKPTNTQKPAGATNTPKPTTSASVTTAPSTVIMTTGFPRDGVVTASKLNVRETASTTADIVSTLSRGDVLNLIEVTRNSKGQYWYKISVTVDGTAKTGYVSSTYIVPAENAGIPTSTPRPTSANTPKPTSTPKPTATPIPTAAPVAEPVESVVAGKFPRNGIVTASSLFVRRDAGTSHEAVASVLRDAVVSVLAAKKDSEGTYWYQISFTQDGVKRTGYVHSQYVLVPKEGTWATPTPTTKPTATPVPKDPNVITKEDINVNDAACYYLGKVTASQLNMRKSPSSSSTVVSVLANATKVMVIGQELSGTSIWYRVAVKTNGVVTYGYVSSGYIELVYDGEVLGTVEGDKIRLRTTAASTGAYVKTNDNVVLTMDSKERVLLTDEVKVSGAKWFLVTVMRNGVKYQGYVPATNIRLTSAEGTAAGTPTPSPRPSATPTLAPNTTPTPSPTPTALPTPVLIKVKGKNYPVNEAGTLSGYGRLYDGITAAVYQEPGKPYSLLKDKDGYIISANRSTTLCLYDMYLSEDGAGFWHVSFKHDGYTYYGYLELMNVEVMPLEKLYSYGGNMTADMANFEYYLDQQGFPESYKPELRELHAKYPNWIFEADITGLKWDDAIEQQSVAGKNLIPNSSSVEWKSVETGAYDWKTDTFIPYDGSTWVTASEDAIAYYMDPRNFLDDTYIFMFEVLRYAMSYQDKEGVENILAGTPFANKEFTYTTSAGTRKTITYADVFIKAAQYSGVSPYHLASRVKQEVVTGSTTTSNSVSGTVSGYEGLYNFFNIGAYHSTAAGGAVINGLKYAKNGASNNDELNDASMIPWTDPYRSILGGAYILGVNYINRGQDTIYLQKFNVTKNSTHFHQYMANVQAPYAEAKKTASAYKDMKDFPIVFSIPVYYDMPSANVSKPGKEYNPNNWLKIFKLFDSNGKEMQITPSFDASQDQIYYLVTEDDSMMLQVVATAVSAKAKVTGTGFYAVEPGSNSVTVSVEAENGDVRNYTVIVVRP